MEFVKLKFVGGEDKEGRKRGPFGSYETGKVYVMPERFHNDEAYPYWEYVGSATEDEIPEPWRTRLGLDKKKKRKRKKKKDQALKTVSKGVIAGSEVNEQNYQKTVEPETSEGLTELYGVATESGLKRPTQTAKDLDESFFRSMTNDQLKAYIDAQGGKWERSWKKKELIVEALRLQ